MLVESIIIQVKTRIRVKGEDTYTWATFVTECAHAVRARGMEQYIFGQRTHQDTKVFRIRFRSDLTREMRVLFESEYWEIVDLNELGRKDGLDIICERIEQT